MENKEIQKWFEWRKGAKRFTIGIEISTKPFIIQMYPNSRQKVLKTVYRIYKSFCSFFSLRSCCFNHLRYLDSQIHLFVGDFKQ